jgi:cyclase
VRDGRVVKGVNFVGFRAAGDPVALAARYNEEGADELVFLDIAASVEGRQIFLDVLRRTASQLFIPLSVGGGMQTIEDVRLALANGADKVSLNTAIVKNPALVREAANEFGSQCVIASIDAKRSGNKWKAFIYGGRTETSFDAVEWAAHCESLGAGEILLTSMDADGTKQGFDVELTRAVCETVRIPVIASGGAGTCEDFAAVFEKTGADAALAASVFHSEETKIGEIKKFLKSRGVVVR